MSSKSTKQAELGAKGQPIPEKPDLAQVTLAPLKPMASANQLARMLGCKPRTIHEWRRTGKIPHYRIGRVIVFDWDEVRAHLAKSFHVPATNVPTQEPKQ